MAQEHEPDLPGPASGEPRSPGALVPADTLQRYVRDATLFRHNAAALVGL